MLTRLRYGKHQFQRETATSDDRYPQLFAECRERLAKLACPRILSYGCSTGEEVFTLARYMPGAWMVGVDINRWCLRQCRKKNVSLQLRFVHRMATERAFAGGFDAIFCLAVFQRTEHRTRRAKPEQTGFTFEQFEAEIAMLDRTLHPGGLLFLDHCDFSFEQTIVARGYAAAEFEGNRVVRERPLFDAKNRLIARGYSLPRCFVKHAVALPVG